MMRKPIWITLLLAGLAACSSSSDTAPDGSVQLLLTDAGLDDLVAFEVDVTAVRFERADGALVSSLPRAARVDFVELEEVAELVGRAQLAPGRYTGMTLTVDFANATALLVDQTTPAAIVDGNGDPLTGEVEVAIAFPTGGQGVVAPNRNHVVQLDLDLSQSIDVDLGANRVAFEPVVEARFDPTDPKPALVRGRIGSVDVAASQLVVERMAPDGSPLASVTVATDTATVFQVDGEVLTGSFGLQAVDALADGARIWVQGRIDPSLPGIRAVAVEAGAGVPGGDQDEVEGWIVGRSGGAGQDAQLQVLGRSVARATATRRFHTSFTVAVEFAGTRVLQRGAAAASSTDVLQVGQRVHAFGALQGTSLDAGVVADGVVRALSTRVLGVARDAAVADQLRIDVQRIGAIAIGAFDFTVAGLVEADPSDLRVDVTGIDVAALANGSRVAVRGHTNAVGVLSDADFRADSVVDRSASRSLLAVLYPFTGVAGALTVGTSTLTLDTTGARFARVLDGFGGHHLAASPAPGVVPAAASGSWRLAQGRSVALFRDFETFLGEVAQAVGGGARVVHVRALGGFDVGTQRLTAVTGVVRLR